MPPAPEIDALDPTASIICAKPVPKHRLSTLPQHVRPAAWCAPVCPSRDPPGMRRYGSRWLTQGIWVANLPPETSIMVPVM